MLMVYDPGCLSLQHALQLPANKVILATCLKPGQISSCKDVAFQPNMSGPSKKNNPSYRCWRMNMTCKSGTAPCSTREGLGTVPSSVEGRLTCNQTTLQLLVVGRME